MDHGKLFKVLVLGGAMLGTGCLEESAPIADASSAPDAAAPADAQVAPGEDAAAAGLDAGGIEGDAGELVECGFCPNEACCVTDESGSHPRPGMMCCWGTGC